MRNRKQKAVLFLKIFAVIITICIVLLFVFRDSLLQTAIAKIENKMANDYDTKLTIEKANFDGISAVQFQKINVVPNNADTLFSVEKVNTKINLFKLLFGTIQLEKLEMKNGFIQLVKNKNGRNFDAFLKRNKEDNSPSENSNYAKSAYRLLSRVLNLIPTEMQLENLSFRMDDRGRKVALTDAIYAIEPNDHAVYLDVKQYLANQRQGTHKSKERAEITGSTRKIKKQKGTGTARAGSIKSPVMRGGGRAFGPRPRNYSFKLNKKLKTLARKSAFTMKAKDNAIVVLENVNFDSPKTSSYSEMIGNLGLNTRKTLLVLAESNKNVYLSSRNLKGSDVVICSELSTYKILNANQLVLLESSLNEIKTNLSK